VPRQDKNPENSVGLIATAGRAVEVCVPLTQDLGKLIAALHKVKISGEANFVSAIRVAQLALRHRQKTGKKQEQRIVLFVGSPIAAEKQELEDIGKQLKKNSIAIDIVSFGEPNAQENEEKLQGLLTQANNQDENGKDNSHFVPIPTGNMSDILAQMTGDQAGGAASMELDPELAWAMELSKQTFEQENKQAGGSSSETSVSVSTDKQDVEMKDTEEQVHVPQHVLPFGGLGAEDDNDPELLEAIRLSLQDTAGQATQATGQATQATGQATQAAGQVTQATGQATQATGQATQAAGQATQATSQATGQTASQAAVTAPAPVVSEEAFDDPDLEEAINLSKSTAKEDKKRDELKTEKKEEKKEQPAEKKEEHKKEDMELDISTIGPEYMESVLMGLPIDKDDPEVQKLLQAFKKDDKDKDKEKK